MQNTLLAIAFALIGAFIGAIAGPMLIDWEARKPELEAEASRMFGLPVKLDGQINLRLLPVPTLSVTRARVGGGTGLSVEVERMNGEVLLGSLLRGEIALGALDLDAPVLKLDLSSLREGLALPPIARLNINRGRITITGQGPTLDIAAIDAKGEGIGGGLTIDGRATVAGQIWSGSARLALGLKPQMQLRLKSTQGLTLESDSVLRFGATPDLSGPTVISGTGPAAFRLKGQLEANLSTLALTGGEGELSGPQHLPFTASLRYRRANPRLDAEFSARRVEWPQGPPGQTPLTALGALSDNLTPLLPDTALSVNVFLGEAVVGGQSLRDTKLAAGRDNGAWTLVALATRFADGTLLSTNDGHIAVTTPVPERLLAFLAGEPLPAGPSNIGVTEAQATLVRGKDGFSLALEDVHSALFAASGSLTLAQADKSLRGQIAFSRLSMEAVPALAQALSSLRNSFASAEGALSVASLSQTGKALGSGALNGRLQDGVLSVNQFRFTGSDGSRAKGDGVLLTSDPSRKAELSGTLTLGDKPEALITGIQALGLTLPPDALSTALSGLSLDGRVMMDKGMFEAQARGATKNGLVQFHAKANADGMLDKVELSLGARDLGALLPLVGFAAPVAAEVLPGVVQVHLHPQGARLLLTARVENDRGALSFEGETARDLSSGEGQANAALITSAPWLSLFGLSPLFGESAISLSGPVIWDATSFRVDAKGPAGAEPLIVTLDKREDGLSGLVVLPRLDGDAVLAALTREGESVIFERLARLKPDIAVSLGALNGPGGLSDLSFALTAGAGSLTAAHLNGRSLFGPVQGDVTLQRVAGRVQASGQIKLTPRLGASLKRAKGDGPESGAQITARFFAEGTSGESLSASLTGTADLETAPLDMAGIDAGALSRIARFAERQSDQGKAFDMDRLGRLMREEAARPVTLSRMTLKGPLVGFGARLPLDRVKAGEGDVSGLLALDATRGRAQFSGTLALSGQKGDDPVPPLALQADWSSGTLALSYGLDDFAGWLALRLVAREEEALRNAAYDRAEVTKARQRLDRLAPGARSPVVSSGRFIAPRGAP